MGEYYLEIPEHLPPKELKLIKADPWKEMAIEKQFRPLVPEETPWDGPATLVYLQEEGHKWVLDSPGLIANEMMGPMSRAEEALMEALSLERYLLALINILWSGPEETMPSVAMNETLRTPDQLIAELLAHFN